MASKVNRRIFFVEGFFFFFTVSLGTLDFYLPLCTAFFFTRLQPHDCIKQLIKV